MATYNWTVPTGNIITGSTYIKDTDNKIQDTIDDLADFVNSSGTHTGQGLMFDYVNKADNQTITGIKTFSNGLIGNVTGNVTGTLTGNITGTAPKLATARTITLDGDVTGSVSFDGSANASITTTVGDDSHNHSIAYVTGLQTALNGKLSTSGNAVSATKLATSRTISLSGDATGSVSFDGSANVNITATVNYATSSGTATNATNADKLIGRNWHWSGQGGQPSWLWGSTDDGTNNYVYNPSNFNVNYANSSNYSNSAGTANSATSITYNAAAWGNAQLVTGEIGTYAFLSNVNATSIEAGGLYAGSNLRYSAISDNLLNSSQGNVYITAANSPSGTWKAMGHSYLYSTYKPATLFLRVA